MDFAGRRFEGHFGVLTWHSGDASEDFWCP